MAIVTFIIVKNLNYSGEDYEKINYYLFIIRTIMHLNCYYYVNFKYF